MSKFYCFRDNVSTGKREYFGILTKLHEKVLESVGDKKNTFLTTELGFYDIEALESHMTSDVIDMKTLFIFDTLTEFEMECHQYFRAIRKSEIASGKSIDETIPKNYTIEPYEFYEKNIFIVEVPYQNDSLYHKLEERDEMADYDYSAKHLLELKDNKDNIIINSEDKWEHPEDVELIFQPVNASEKVYAKDILTEKHCDCDSEKCAGYTGCHSDT